VLAVDRDIRETPDSAGERARSALAAGGRRIAVALLDNPAWC
jgi:hypothetical protein